MRHKSRILFALGLFGTSWALCQGPTSESPPPPGQPAATVKGQSTTVLVDVVVRDKKGRPVSDLTADDFEVREDGVPQKITFFQTPEETAQDASGLSGKTQGFRVPSALRDVLPEESVPKIIQTLHGGFTAILFSVLKPENRVYVRQAARKYVSDAAADSWLGVFKQDRILQTLQFFSRDRDALKAAIEQGTGASITRLEPVDQQIWALTATLKAQEGIGGPTLAGMQTDASSTAINLMKLRMLEMVARIQRRMAGNATMDGLQALVATLKMLPGRKSILFFSEGIIMPPGVDAWFRSVIHAANRAHVSIYTIDAAGLRVESTGADMAKQIETYNRGGLGHGSLRSLEKNEDYIHSDAQKGLNILADQTGGIFIRDTNDLAAGLERINQDLHSYYLLAYGPTNSALDGTFRTIDVQVDVPDADVQFRKGYYAVDTLFDEEPVLEYELPALAMLERGTAADSIPVASTALSFPNPKEPGLVSILATLPPGVLQYKDDGDVETSDFAFVALVRDADGNLVRKVSQQYRLSHTKEAPTPGDGILFYREVRLDPGRYMVAVAGFDAIAGVGGISRSEIGLPEPDPRLPEISSLVLVDRAEKMTGDRSVPLRVGDVLLYPAMSDRIRKSEHLRLDFFFSLYPTEDVPKEAVVEVLHYSTTLVRTRVDLSAPDSDGRITYQGTLPLSNLPDGIYTLRVLVPTGDRAVARSRRFIIEE